MRLWSIGIDLFRNITLIILLTNSAEKNINNVLSEIGLKITPALLFEEPCPRSQIDEAHNCTFVSIKAYTWSQLDDLLISKVQRHAKFVVKDLSDLRESDKAFSHIDFDKNLFSFSKIETLYYQRRTTTSLRSYFGFLWW